MPLDVATKVGNASATPSGNPLDKLYSDLFGALKVSPSAMRFYELNRLGLLYTVGNQDQALIAANATATGLSASAKPIIGVFNPLGSGVDLVILKSNIQITTVANSAVNPTGFYYVTGSAGNNPISTGTANGAINCKTLLKAGSAAQTFTGGNTALTGLVGNAVIVGPVGQAPVLNAGGAATAVSLPQGPCLDMLEGSLIVKPGQFLGIMNEVSITTLSITSALMWAELPTLA